MRQNIVDKILTIIHAEADNNKIIQFLKEREIIEERKRESETTKPEIGINIEGKNNNLEKCFL